MALTLDTLLEQLGLKLATGQDAAGVTVRWVHSTELLDPTPFLTGGEVLLTAGIQLNGTRVQREFVHRLVDHGIAGLGMGTGLGHDTLPPAIVAAALERGFPVFEVPYEVPFIAIAERASAHLFSEQYAALRRSVAVQGRLERLVLDQRGLGALTEALAETVGGAVGVIGPRGDTLVWQEDPDRPGSSDSERDALARLVRERSSACEPVPAALEPDVGGPPGRALLVPVIAREPRAPQAWLAAVRDEVPLEDFERLILRQAATVVALELMRQRVERDTERRLAGNVLAEALTGQLAPDELQARLRPFGIGRRAAVLAFSLADPPAGEPVLDCALARADVRALVATRGALLCAVIDGEHDPVEVARDARAQLAAELAEVRAAASAPADTHALPRSFHEARCALEAVRFGNGTAPEVATERDLGVFRLLLSLQDRDALRAYCASVLGPVEQGENGYGDELLRSLDVFIEQNGHWERAASTLFCHRHTLRYRIRRIEQLTGRDLGRAQDRIEFWLALRAREMAT